MPQINGNRTAITSNDLVEGTLGKFGIICVEDLIHEVIYCPIRSIYVLFYLMTNF